MRAHEAGALHGDIGFRGPHWLRQPSDVNALLPQLWPRTVHRGADGALRVGTVDVRAIAEEFGTPAYVLDEADFRSRCRDFRDAFAGADVFYAAKAFCAKAVVRIAADEGLNLDVCTGGELAVALAAGMPPGRIKLHGNNKSLVELRRALEAGVGWIVVDSFDEISRLTDLARSLRLRPKVMVRVTVGVEAHTHEFIATAHEDQKFGFSLGSGAAFEAAARILNEDVLDLAGLHSHIGSQIFDTSGFEVSARRVLGLQDAIRTTYGRELSEVDLGGGFGIAYRADEVPLDVPQLAEELRAIVKRECYAADLDVPTIAVEPGRAIAAPGTVTLYEVGTLKDVDLGGGHGRRYVSVDGGMSDNIRTALYDAVYDCRLVSRSSEVDGTAAPTLSRVVGKHCESGDIVVRDCWLPADLAPGDLLAVAATGAYCYAMASSYNRLPRPAVVAVRDGAARVLLRRETADDLFRLEVAQ